MKKLLFSLLLLSSAASYSMEIVGTCGGGAEGLGTASSTSGTVRYMHQPMENMVTRGGGRGELIGNSVAASVPLMATTSALASTGIVACNPSVIPTIFGIPTLCKAAIGAGISFASSPAALLAVPVLVGVGTYKLIKYNTPAEKKN